MYNKFLNFYLPQGIVYFIAPIVLILLRDLLILGGLVLIFIVLFRNKEKIKSIILKLYFFISFLVYCYSLYIAYLPFKASNPKFDIAMILSFFVVFGVIFLIYYIPWIVVLLLSILVNFVNKKFLLDKNKGGKA